jgi:hypothetical protein
MNEEYMTDTEFNEVLNEFLLQPTAKLAEEYREFRQQIGGDRNV